jgi:hypothetical protein
MNGPEVLTSAGPSRVAQGSRPTLHPPAADEGVAAASGGPASVGLDHVVVLVLIDLAPGSLVWGWSRIVFGGWLLRGVEGLCFSRALGSGQDGGFGLKPSATRQGLFLLFGDEAAADRFLADSPVLAAYRRHAREICTAKLRAVSSRGRWSGEGIDVTADSDPAGPVAALTRASIKPGRAWSFWRHSPASEQSLEQAAGCRLAVGLGEAPVLRQATFSIWDSQAQMDAYARQGAHLQAIEASRREGYFSESMFVRFKILQLSGAFKGRHHG